MKTGLDVVQALLSAVFAADIVANFNVATYDRRVHRYTTDRRRIAAVYLAGGPIAFFWVDFLAVFPFHTVVGAAYGCDPTSRRWRLLKLVMLLRLFRLVRLRIARPAQSASTQCASGP